MADKTPPAKPSSQTAKPSQTAPADPPKLRPTERRFYDLLSDGKAHSHAEFYALLWDDQGGDTIVQTHVCNLRRKVFPAGKVILGRRRDGVLYYQMYPLALTS